MADGGDIVLPVRLDSTEAEKVWRELKTKFEKDPPKLPPPVPSPNTPKPDPGAGSFWDNLTEKMQRYRREEVQQTRLTGFFARELQSLGIAAGQSGQMLGKLAIVLGSGSLFAMGFEAAKFMGEALVDMAEESEKARLAAEKMYLEGRTALAELGRAWEDYYRKANQGTAGFGDAAVRASDNIARLQADIDNLALKWESARSNERRAANEWGGLSADRRGESLGIQLEQEAKLRQQDAERQQYVTRGQYEDRWRAANEANKKLRELEVAAAQATASDRAKIEIEADAQITELRIADSQRRAAAQREIQRQEELVNAEMSKSENFDPTTGELYVGAENRIKAIRAVIEAITQLVTQNETQTGQQVDAIRRGAGTRTNQAVLAARREHETRMREVTLDLVSVTADERRNLELKAQDAIDKIEDQRKALRALAQTADVKEQITRLGDVELRQREANAARILEFDIKAERDHAAKIRAVRAEIAGLEANDEISRLEAQIAARRETDLDALMVAQRQNSPQGFARANEQMAANEERDQARLVRARFTAAKAENDARLAVELGAEEAENDIADRRIERERKVSFLIQAGLRADVATRLETLQQQEDAELDLLNEATDAQLEAFGGREASMTAIRERYSMLRVEALRKESVASLATYDLMQTSINSFAQSVGAGYEAMATRSSAYESAMERQKAKTLDAANAKLADAERAARQARGTKDAAAAAQNLAQAQEEQRQASLALHGATTDLEGAVLAFVQSSIAAIGKEAAVKAAFYAAEALAATFFNPPAAAAYWAASAQMAATAAIAGAAAMAIGATRPMTAAERESVDSGAGSVGGGYSNESLGATGAGGGAGGAQVIRIERYFIVGDPFETPQETARRAARTVQLAERLDMLARTA